MAAETIICEQRPNLGLEEGDLVRGGLCHHHLFLYWRPASGKGGEEQYQGRNGGKLHEFYHFNRRSLISWAAFMQDCPAFSNFSTFSRKAGAITVTAPTG